MNPTTVFLVIAIYFSLLIFISWLTSRNADNASFYTGNKASPWYLVAFGMIGASLSGVTFISVPGDVGNINFYYFQLVLGYLAGYATIALVLLPLYYKNNLVSIYQFLRSRFGLFSYKTGSAFFLLSQLIGASFRLFLVATVLQIAFFDAFHIPFFLTVAITIALIWIYTWKAGIKTVVYTDTLQTTFMILAVIATFYFVSQKMNFSLTDAIQAIHQHSFSDVFDWNIKSPTNFYKQFVSGAFIAIVMTGLDQNMMQKNLTVKTLRDSQKNMFWFSLSLVPVNLLFMSMGILLYIYGSHIGIEFIKEQGHMQFLYNGVMHSPDDLFPVIAIHKIGGLLGIFFLIGIIAAAFSSADSSLTALTTAFVVDFLGLDIQQNSKRNKNLRLIVHIGFSILLLFVIILFKWLNDSTVITAVFKVAGYTYGPLLGLFAFGLISKRKIRDKYVPFIAIAAPVATYFIGKYSAVLFWGYHFGFELLLVNGLLMYWGLYAVSYRTKMD